MPSAIAERFDPVGLGELQGSGAALLDRVDRKYVVPVETFAALAERLVASHRVLEIGGARTFALPHRVLRHAGPRRVPRPRPAAPAALQVPLAALRGERRSARSSSSSRARAGRTVKHRMPYDGGAARLAQPGGDPLPPRAPAARLRPRTRRRARALAGHVLPPPHARQPRARRAADRRLRPRVRAAGGRLADGAVIVESKSPRGVALADRVLRDARRAAGGGLQQVLPRDRHDAAGAAGQPLPAAAQPLVRRARPRRADPRRCLVAGGVRARRPPPARCRRSRCRSRARSRTSPRSPGG